MMRDMFTGEMREPQEPMEVREEEAPVADARQQELIFDGSPICQKS